MPRPIPNSYWVEPGGLLAGEYPGSRLEKITRKVLRQFLSAGITHFVDLTVEGELEPYASVLREEALRHGISVVHSRMPLRDVRAPGVEEMRKILDTIDAALKSGHVVYVHCWGGLGRTGTVIGCYLVRHGRSGPEALHELNQLWRAMEKSSRNPHIPETLEQENLIRNWSEAHPVALQPDPLRALDGRNNRYLGCLLGLAVGDALGTTLEFKPYGSFRPIYDMVGGGPFHLQPGQWTDDTSMALCLAASLVERQGFDALDQMQRYQRWVREGYMSSTGRCFDVGNTTEKALLRFAATGDPFSGLDDPSAAGNGSLMRLAPVAMAYAHRSSEVAFRAAESSRTTHATTTCVDACRFFAGLLAGALNGAPKRELLSARFAPVPGAWDSHPLHPAIARIAEGSYKKRYPPSIRGTGYVVDCLEAALWAFYRSENFPDGALMAVNLGDDADTTGAVYGQLAGAFYGAEAIPAPWRERLAMRSTLESLAGQLHDLAAAMPAEQPSSGAHPQVAGH